MRNGSSSRNSSDRNGGRARSSLQRQLFKRRKTCLFCEKGAPKIDYKDVKLLQKYLSERGRIMPRRISFVSAEHQRELATAVKRARHLALLPYVVQ